MQNIIYYQIIFYIQHFTVTTFPFLFFFSLGTKQKEYEKKKEE